MDKSNFIHWLFDKFNVNDNEYDIRFNQYFKGLKNDLKFEAIQNKIEKDSSINMPSWLCINSMEITEEIKTICDSKSEALYHIRQLEKEPHIDMKDFDEYLKNKIREFCSKHGKTPCFDRKAE